MDGAHYQDLDDLLGEPATVVPLQRDNGRVALELANRGLRVFPICYRRENDEWSPIVKFPERASSDAAQVAAWWVDWPDARVGLLTGAANGITVLDVDVKNGKDGRASLAALGLDLDAMSPVRVRTPSGGWHLFFRHEPRMKNWVGGGKLPEGLDCRTDRAFVIAPGSYKDDGHYEPVGEPLGLCDLPAFPAALILPPEPERPAVAPLATATECQREWAAEELATKAAALAEIEEGGRNQALNDAAMWAGGAAAHGFLERDHAEALLWDACEANGLRRGEFKGTFKSGWQAGLRKPIAEFLRDVDLSAFEDLDAPARDDVLGPAKTTVAPDTPAANPLFFDVADWEGRPVPERQWLVPDIIPMGTVTLLYGDGGNGKSLLALQLAAAIASGDPWIGKPVREGKAMFLSAEDSEDELHRRMVDVANADGNSLASYRDKLLVRSMVDGNPLLAILDKTHVLKPSALYKELRATVEAKRPAVLVLDTLGNLFPGNENDRAQVTLFAALLKRLAERSGCAVFLLAHPSKSGMSTGSGDSGSTAWNGNVRSRLYLDKYVTDGVQVNPKLRRLTHLKANYGPRAEPMVLEWHRGVFRSGSGAVEESASRVAAKFLELVATYAAEGKSLHPRNGPTFAPKVMAEDPRSGSFTKAQFKSAMAALTDSGRIWETTCLDSKGRSVATIKIVEDAFSSMSGSPPSPSR